MEHTGLFYPNISEHGELRNLQENYKAALHSTVISTQYQKQGQKKMYFIQLCHTADPSPGLSLKGGLMKCMGGHNHYYIFFDNSILYSRSIDTCDHQIKYNQQQI